MYKCLLLFSTDVQQLLVVKEEVLSEQQVWISSLDQVHPQPPLVKEEQEDQENPEHPHIKEEQEDQENPEHPHIKEEQEDQENPEPPHIKEEQEDQENPEPPQMKEEQEDQENSEPPHIKGVHEDLWTNEEGEQLQGLEEAGLKFLFTPEKSEAEEEAQSSQLHQRQTEHMEIEADGDDCGGPEPARNADPDRRPDPDEKIGESSEPDTDDSRVPVQNQ
ncbi:hypothetical protein EYF80_046885 [Liparis tanakae]|uniref:Uncharacterized protein n=1 Tax=Liparis tanakae TaxID=230148 RepID=A0A4Z2FNX6_9TELE|nr:hypothetical protein EYF80_046885 [Liparis tanakae]